MENSIKKLSFFSWDFFWSFFIFLSFFYLNASVPTLRRIALPSFNPIQLSMCRFLLHTYELEHRKIKLLWNLLTFSYRKKFSYALYVIETVLRLYFLFLPIVFPLTKAWFVNFQFFQRKINFSNFISISILLNSFSTFI